MSDRSPMDPVLDLPAGKWLIATFAVVCGVVFECSESVDINHLLQTLRFPILHNLLLLASSYDLAMMM